jgi:hypothetical protein
VQLMLRLFMNCTRVESDVTAKSAKTASQLVCPSLSRSSISISIKSTEKSERTTKRRKKKCSAQICIVSNNGRQHSAQKNQPVQSLSSAIVNNKSLTTKINGIVRLRRVFFEAEAPGKPPMLLFLSAQCPLSINVELAGRATGATTFALPMRHRNFLFILLFHLLNYLKRFCWRFLFFSCVFRSQVMRSSLSLSFHSISSTLTSSRRTMLKPNDGGGRASHTVMELEFA